MTEFTELSAGGDFVSDDKREMNLGEALLHSSQPCSHPLSISRAKVSSNSAVNSLLSNLSIFSFPPAYMYICDLYFPSTELNKQVKGKESWLLCNRSWWESVALMLRCHRIPPTNIQDYVLLDSSLFSPFCTDIVACRRIP